MITLTLTNTDGTFDLTGLIGQLTWSGEYRQGARKLVFTAASSVPTTDLAPGGLIHFYEDGTLLFSGIIVSRNRATGSNTIQVTAYDRGFYLIKNQAVYQFRSMTADRITRQICSEFGVEVGTLASAGTPISRNFIGVTLYKIIQTAYTLQAKADGKAYQIRFRGDALEVCEIGLNSETVVIESGTNLQSASMQDSIENTVTEASIYDTNSKLIRTLRNADLTEIYGVLRRIIRQPDGEDSTADAQKILDENGLAQTIKTEAMGDVRCITGSTVAVEEPYTGLYGLFWITADKHVWKNGLHYMELSLSCKRLMDEQEAGTLPKAASDALLGKVPLNMIQYETLQGGGV